MNMIKDFKDLPGYSRSLIRQPFRWARVKAAELMLISRLPMGERIAAMANLKPLRHRGKGKDKTFAKKIENRKSERSAYMPHQGKQEIARRLARMAA